MQGETFDKQYVEVEFSEERDYGAVKVKYAIKQIFEITEEFDILAARIELRSHVYAMFADYEVHDLPNTKQAQYKQTVEAQPNADNWQRALKFRRDVKGNKVYYNIVTPRYPKFGVACWDECKGRDNLIAKLGDRNEIDLDGYRVLVNENGKYPKGTEIDLSF